MKAIRLHGPRDVRLDEVPEPGEPGPFELLVAPQWNGICGSDLKGYIGDGTTFTGPLRVMGHEFSARVVSAGREVSRVAAGDLVSVMPLEYCGHCLDCQRGDFYLCPNKSFTGLFGTSALGGGLGDLVLLKDYQAIPLGNLTPEQGAVVEPAAVALHAILELGVDPGDTVLVVGCGPIGCLVIMAAQAAGAAVVLACEPNPGRAAVAVDLGAVLVDAVTPAEQLEQIRALAPARAPVNIAFDCAGKDGTMDLCIGAVKTGGRIGVVAGHMPSRKLTVEPIQHKPVSIIGSLAYTQTAWDRTLALMNAGKYPAERIVTAHIRREAIAAQGFEALLDPAGKNLKILIGVGAGVDDA